MQNPASLSHYSVREEWANVLTHGLGVVLAIAASAVLLTYAVRDGDPLRIVTLGVFGVTLIGVYVTSTLYHLAYGPRLKPMLRRLDHACIFLLIAGTYTPLMLVTLGGRWGWSMFGVAWGMAAVGLTLKVFYFDRWGWVQLGLKLAMGWLVMVAIVPVVAAISTPGLAWVVAGGLCYTGGVAFFLWDTLKYHHAVWHLFVLAGSACHVMAMVTDVLPLR